MDYNLVGKVRFCVHGHYIETFTEFLAAFPEIKLSLLDRMRLKNKSQHSALRLTMNFSAGISLKINYRN